MSILLLAALGCGTSVALGLHLAVRWDPNYPNKEIAAIWLAYLTGRISYRVDHKALIPNVGEIEPLFEEEVFARDLASQAYANQRGKSEKMRDPYWNDLVEVTTKGFMREYIWTYLRRPSWPEKEKPAKLAAFKNWQRQHLRNHQPQTHGALKGEN